MMKNNINSRFNGMQNQKPVSKEQAFNQGNTVPVYTSKQTFKAPTKTKGMDAKHVSSRFTQGNSSEIYVNEDADLEKDLEEARNIKASREKSKKLFEFLKSSKGIDCMFLVGCIYLVFLIFGVFVTEYQYDESGLIVAQQMSYEDVVAKKSFEVLINQYIECRKLYEEVLIIDVELAKGETSAMTLSPKYETIVSKAEVLYTKTEAMSIDKKYEQVRAMMLTWIEEELATYAKSMSAAISQNSENLAKNALALREKTYNDFVLITQNIIAMGDTLTGVDLVDIKEWDIAKVIKSKEQR